MVEACDDRALIRDISGGDREALAALYDRYAESMMAVGLKYLDSESDAEEVIHEVFLEVWEKAHSYDAERATVYTWLMVKMRSRALDKQRYEGRREHPRVEDAADDREAERGDPADALEHRWIRDAVDELPERLRGVLICTYFYEMTGPETAEELEIPVGTVRSRLRSARTALRDYLRPDTVAQGE